MRIDNSSLNILGQASCQISFEIQLYFDMQQASRIAILAFLTLLQFFAPLVHAHAGGRQFSGAIHVPGLEFLSKANGNSVQGIIHEAGADLIVGLADGFRDQKPATQASPESNDDLPPNSIFALDFISGWGQRLSIFAVALNAPHWRGSGPRAPPSPV